MKIGEMLNSVIQSFRTDQYQNLIATVDPKYKDVITFLLNCSISTLERPYGDRIRTRIHSGPFSYEMAGDPDKITLNVDSKFFENGGNFKEFFRKLYLAIENLTKNLSEDWSRSNDPRLGMAYENKNLSGTYYAFLLNNVVKLLGLNNIYFYPWMPIAGWNLDFVVYARGDEESIQKFISSVGSELAISSGMIIPAFLADKKEEKEEKESYTASLKGIFSGKDSGQKSSQALRVIGFGGLSKGSSSISGEGEFNFGDDRLVSKKGIIIIRYNKKEARYKGSSVMVQSENGHFIIDGKEVTTNDERLIDGGLGSQRDATPIDNKISIRLS